MVYGLKYTRIFKKQIESVKKKDKALMEELAKKVKKLQDVPYSGKPLKYRLSHYRSLRVLTSSIGGIGIGLIIFK